MGPDFSALFIIYQTCLYADKQVAAVHTGQRSNMHASIGPYKNMLQKRKAPGGSSRYHTDTFSCHRIKQSSESVKGVLHSRQGVIRPPLQRLKHSFFNAACSYFPPSSSLFFALSVFSALFFFYGVSPVGPTSVPLLAAVIFTVALFGAHSLTE